MMVVPDIDDLFLPIPDDLLVNLSDSMSVVEVCALLSRSNECLILQFFQALLDGLSNSFHGNQRVESALGPALRGAYGVMVCCIDVVLLSANTRLEKRWR